MVETVTAEPAVLLVLAAIAALAVGLLLFAEWQDRQREQRRIQKRFERLMARREARDPTQDGGA